MAETNPLLDMSILQAAVGSNSPSTPVLPNVPFTAPNTPLPMVDGEPTPSALSAIENSVLAVPSKQGMLTGGSIARGLDEVTSSRYDVVVPGDYNNEDAYAQGQGWPSKMVNGVGKGLLLTGTTLLQTTAGTLNGLARMVADGRAASFYDNEFNRALDEINKAAEDSLPNYYTDVEKNARWYSPSKLFTANFLWDGIVKNLGFAAGAAISGGLYASALRAIPLTSRLFSVGKAAETLAATEEGLLAANKAAETYGKIKSLSDRFLSSYNFLNPAGRGLVAALSTTGEAGFEAFHNLNEFRDKKIQEWKDSHGGQEPRGADLQAINAEADRVGNTSFLLNTTLLSATNYIQFPKILGSSYTAEKGMINSLVKEVADITKDATGKFVKKEAKGRAGKLLSALNVVRPYTFSASEAFEEGAQFAIGVGTQDYYNKKYDGDVATFLESLTEGIAQTFGTDEGMQNVLIGGLSGALMQGKGRFRQEAEKRRNTADAIQAFNKWTLSDFTKETIDAVNRGTTLQKEREALLRQGDILESKEKETDYIINYLTPRIKYGRYDLVKSDIEDYKRLASTDEGFAQLQAEGKVLATDTKSAYLQRLASLESNAENIKSLYQSLQLRYGNLVDENQKPIYSGKVMDQMIYAATKVADYDRRLPQLASSLLTAGIDTDSVIEGVLNGETTPFNEAVAQIQALKINSDEKEKLVETLTDFAEISLRRDKFLKEYDEIKNSPNNFDTPDAPEVKPGEAPKTLTIKTKDGEEDLIVGEEYFLGRVVEYDKDGKEVYRFPRLTILGENEDGTIKIKDGKGNVKDVSKSVLEDYKLGKVSDTLSNKKAKFYMENANSIFEFNFGKGKKQKGRLEYSSKDKVLNFVYKDKKGKIRKIEVTADQFVPKKGYNVPIISKVGTLTAVEKQTLEEFLAEEDARIAAKRTTRLQVLDELYTELSTNHTKLQKLINQKKSELANLNDELAELREKIEKDSLTPKKGNLKATARRAMDASMRLTRMQDQLVKEIETLEAERDELEMNAEYVADLSQNIDQMPTDSKEFLEELREQKTALEDAIVQTGLQINSISGLIDAVEKTIQKAINFLSDVINEFTKKYPKAPLALGQEWVDFIKDNPNFLKLKPNYKQDLKEVEDMVAQIEDIEIKPDETKLAALRDELSNLQKTLQQTEKELSAKTVILNKFEEVAARYKKQKEEEQKLANDEKLRKELLGSADPGLQTRPFDKDYEAQSKKTNVGVVSSSKQWFDVNAPHAVRANTFGANLDSFPNRANIKAVLVTSKNEASILPGLTKFLKGNSNVDADKIIALVMVQDGKPVGVDGKPLIDSTATTVYKTAANIAAFSEIAQPKGTVEEKLAEIGKFIKVNLGWNITYINASKEKDRIELTVDGKQLNLPQGANIRVMAGNQAYPSFTLDDILAVRASSANDLLNKAIFQVMPDPKLTWNDGSSMFRKETTPEQVEYYKKQYAEWVKDVLANPSLQPVDIEASFGIPEYVTFTDEKGNQVRDYDAAVSVEDAGLIKSSDLAERPLVYIPTVDTTVEKGSTLFNSPLGRPFLNLPNGYVKLNNRKLTKKEAVTIYSAIYALSQDVFKNGNAQSDKSKRLINWLRSIIYWGTPQDRQTKERKPSGYNSVFFENIEDDFRLFISGKGKSYSFAPSALEANKSEIIALLEGMYNNINSGKTDKDGVWNDTYEEIINITPSGEIETKEWPNYQTYLLSLEGRKPEELPLSVQIKPKKEGESNRNGIYFTIKDTADRFSAPPEKRVIKPQASAPTPAPTQSGKTPVGTIIKGSPTNTYVSATGKKILFGKDKNGEIVISKGGDLAEVFADLAEKVGEEKAKENIKSIIKVALAASEKQDAGEEIVIGGGNGKPKRDLFNKGTSSTEVQEQPAPAPPKRSLFEKADTPTVTITDEDEQEMNSQMEDMDDDDGIVLRVLLENNAKFESENWKQAEEWLAANFPNLPVYRVKNIIQATNGLQAWGMLKDGAIYVYENAEVGTIYHEVFEGVWKAFTNAKEQNSIRAEFRARKGSFIDRPTGRTVKYADATDVEVKEQLAEEFRDYVLANKTEKKGVIAKLFSDIIAFIKSFFLGPKGQVNTQKLFEKIGTGYYKQHVPLQSKLSFGKTGIIDIEEAFASAYSEFRIKNLPAETVHDIMQQMTYITLTDLLKNNKSLFSFPKINRTELYVKLKSDLQKTVLRIRKQAEDDVKEGKITAEQAKPAIERSVSLWKSITTEWDQLTKKHEEYLRVYSIEFDENDEVVLKDEDASKKGDYQDATKIDTFKKANSAIKLLLSTLPRVGGDGKAIPSSIGGKSLLPTSEVFMAIMNNVHTARNIDEMMSRLKEMGDEDANYKTLYSRLTKNTSDLSQISEPHDAQLLAAFWRTFKKQNPEVKNVFILDNGDVEVGDSSLSSAARQISADYNNAIIKVVKGKNPYFEYVEKERIFRGKPAGVKNVKLTSDANRIAFLKSLGIEFKASELAKLPADKIEIFREAVAGIRRSIEKADKIATVNRKVLDIKGRLMQLSQIKAAIENPEFDSTFFNVKGERTQSFIGNNPVSDLYDYLSQINNLNELINTPYEYLLTDGFTKGSVILKKMFNLETGNRIKGNEQLLKPGYADGTIDMQKGKKKQSSKLTYKERLIQEINLNLKGYYYNLVPGDASIEWMVNMGNHVTAENLLSGLGKVNSIFKDYFLAEMALSREERPVTKKRDSKDLRFFKGILGEELHSKILKEKGSPDKIYEKYEAQINKAIAAFIEEETNKFRHTLDQYHIIQQDAEGLSVENVGFAEDGVISEEVLSRNLTALTINFIINNIELHKLLYSDPYQYSDELKRIKSANSPRQAIISNSPAMNAALNRVWNTEYEKGDIGYTDFTKDHFETVTLADVIATSDLKDYGTFEETDGSGIISMKAYRLFRIKAGEWNDEEEMQYKYDVAYEKQVKELPLSEEEQSLLKKGNPSVKSAYTPIKPIVFGNKLTDRNYNDVVLDKFALYPLSFRIAHSINPDSNAVRHYNKMQRENIDYSVFASGRKVGNEGTNSLYNPDGSFNNLPYKAQVKVPHGIISIQSEVPSKEDNASPRGSQVTKLATLDFMEAGVPVDYSSGNFKSRFESWNALSETQKREASPLYKEIKHNQELLEASIDFAYKSLLNRMGIIETEEGGFEIVDPEKIAATLEEEILKREVNDNIIDAFEGFRKGDVVLEATPAYQQIRNILYSIADKNVISPKITGGQKVQIPSTLLESVRVKEEKGAYTSDVLRFYENEDGKRTCEIMVGRWFDSPLSDEELLNYFNKTEEGQKILAGVAYRIPTQKQNSIESFVIKQFLPREFGDSVIVPSALVKKVGSDFDIDKLYIYLKNTYKDHKGRLKLLPFYGFGQQAIDKFKVLFEEIRDLTIVETDKKVEKQYKISALFGDLALGLKEGKVAEKWIPIFQEWFADELVDGRFPVQRIEEIFISRIERLNKKLNTLTTEDMKEVVIAEMAERWYKQSLENQYIQSLQNLVSHPLNFENLIKPNSADQLKKLAKHVTKKRGFEEFVYDDPKNLVSREFMTRLRHSFVSGKYAIGIAAVNQTNHSLNQRQPIYIDIDRWDSLSMDDQYWLSGGTMNAKDAVVKFKNFNKMQIGDKIVATLSMIKNAAGENISDIIGQFIDGYVDISKGPWIMELGAHPNVAGVWLFLAKIGVPINDIAYFMNQPIIRDYLRTIESAGYSWLFIDSFADDMILKYVGKKEISEIKEIPSATALEKMIGKTTEELDAKQKDQQAFILQEFLKYAKMANHMFLVTQGSNFDTASFNDPYLVFKKQMQYKKAQATIISSVTDLTKNSFIGKLSDTIYNMRDAFSTVLSSDRSNVRDVIEQILTPYVDLTDREFVKLAQKAVNDLFDWAVQVDRKLNTQVANILLSDNNAAKQVSDFVTSVRKDPKHPLHNNQVVKLITPHFSSKVGGVNNLKIKNKDNKVYDQNQMIYAFAELRNHLEGINSPLYGMIVRLAVLQSGLSMSPISFTSLLPYEDFKDIYNKTLSTLENLPNLQDYITLNVFQRTNWNNDDIVPLRRAKKSRGGEGKYNTNIRFYGHNQVTKAIERKEIPQLLKLNIRSREANNDVIVYTWVTAFGEKAKKMREKGDFSYIKKGLFKKVYRGNAPLELSFVAKNGDIITDYVYKAINAWGDSHSSDGVYFAANEFYDSARPSVIDNGFIKVEKEVDDTTIIEIFDSKTTVEQPTGGTDQLPNCK